MTKFNLYSKFIFTDKNNEKNKSISPPFTQVTVFLIAEKLLSL